MNPRHVHSNLTSFILRRNAGSDSPLLYATWRMEVHMVGPMMTMTGMRLSISLIATIPACIAGGSGSGTTGVVIFCMCQQAWQACDGAA